MSWAFVKELDDEMVSLPDRAISPPQLCDSTGVGGDRGQSQSVRGAHRAAIDKNDKQAAATALREVRYWSARRANAEVVRPSADPERVAFATTVTLRRDDGREQTFVIVGEDEADPTHGSISYISPLARAAMGRAVGELIELSGKTAVIRI